MEILALLSSLITIQIAFLETDLRMLSGCGNEHVRAEVIRRKVKAIQSLLELLDEIQKSLINSTEFEIETILEESAHCIELLTKSKELSPDFKDLLSKAMTQHRMLTITLTEKEEERVAKIEKQVQILKRGLIVVLKGFQNYDS